MADLATLQIGSTGQNVKNLQITLNTWANLFNRPDFQPGAPDGNYGPKTANAIRSLQAALGLTVDGMVGPRTWDAIQKTGEAILSGQTVAMKPAPSKGTTTTGSVPKPILASSSGGGLSALTAGINWKYVGIAIALGLAGFKYFGGGKR